ncbi:protein translocase subunit SecA, chloroplastic [Arachis hypogaea]|nr:protein translocase subunit SecA, chloroplastic isoform X2 [Arachis hypogaea]
MFLHFSAWCLCRCPSLFQRVSKNGMKDSVNYQIISPKDLAKSVLSSIIEFTREDVEALLNEKAKRKDRFNYKDESDVVFRATSGKWRAVVVEISRMHKTGRPVLVGTTSVEQSDSLSEQLKEAGIPHEVLNAKPENVEREAEIVVQSGRLGAVTIATNMAGRGTDIILDGNAEFMARLKLREILMPRVVKPDDGVYVSIKKPLPNKTETQVLQDLS